MTASDAYQCLISVVQERVILERLFLASLELAAFAACVGVFIIICRPKSPRLAALLWLLVLVKPLVSVAAGCPVSIAHLPNPQVTPTNAVEADSFSPEAPGSTASDNLFYTNLVEPAPGGPKNLPATSQRQVAASHSEEPTAGESATTGRQCATSSLAAIVWQVFTENMASVLLVAWLLGVAWQACLAAVRQMRLRRLVKTSLPVDVCIARRSDDLANRLKIRRAPDVRISDQLESPALVGVWRPVILLPAWMTTNAARKDSTIDWSLRHELTHYKHADPLANAVRGVVQVLFFFHPAAWWAAARWRSAMELACDRAVVETPADAQAYAEGLYQMLAAMQARRRWPLTAALFATRTQIGRRIELLLGPSLQAPRKLSTTTVAALAVLAAASLAVGASVAKSSIASGPPMLAASDIAAFDSVVSDPATTNDEDDSGEPTKPAPAPSVESSQNGTTTADGVIVNHSGDIGPYARAIASTVSSARRAAIDQFGFDMPETIVVDVREDENAYVRLFNDGHDRISLTVSRLDDLAQPRRSGVYHIYGLCHETAHLAMYRPIRNRSWMTTAAAEGFAHYLGARLVDAVYEHRGRDLWPDRYDYSHDGVQRFEEQLASGELNDSQRGSQQWKVFFEQFGDKSAALLFARWGQADYDEANPGPVLQNALAHTIEDPRAVDWWRQAEREFVFEIERSKFTAVYAAPGAGGDSGELSLDSGEAAGKKSIAGGGHAVRFTAPGETARVTAVKLFGSRYGTPRAPREEFRVWLCDAEFKPIADFEFPYARFQRGEAQWVTLDIKPTLVPQEFYVCFGFNPTGTKGVFVSHDGGEGNTSIVGLPGRAPRAFNDGNWMIRAVIEPDASARVWTDASGGFSVKAELVDVQDDQVRLKREDGKVVTVALQQLSAADRQYLKSLDNSPSKEPAENVTAAQLARDPQELYADDGKPAGKKSLPLGIASAFEVEGDDFYLTKIRIHGARYGSPRAPNEDFEVTLCDKNFQPIQQFDLAYSKFSRGDAKWVDLRVKPTRVPSSFIICLDFSPTQTKGVFVSHDAEGKSLLGLPGKPSGNFTGGDWMLRVEVDKLKDTP